MIEGGLGPGESMPTGFAATRSKPAPRRSGRAKGLKSFGVVSHLPTDRTETAHAISTTILWVFFASPPDAQLSRSRFRSQGRGGTAPPAGGDSPRGGVARGVSSEGS